MHLITTHAIILELIEKEFKVILQKDGIRLEGFYKSGTIRLEPEEGGTFRAHSRYDEKSTIESFDDLVELNYKWWQKSKHRNDAWRIPDERWGKEMVRLNLVSKYEFDSTIEPKMYWGRKVLSYNEHTESQYLRFIEELKKFNTELQIEERKKDIDIWDEFSYRSSFMIEALFSEKEVNHFLSYYKNSFTLLEDVSKNEEGLRKKIDNEWLQDFIEEEKIIHGEMPSASNILYSWKQNKEYFFANKGKPCGVVKVVNN